MLLTLITIDEYGFPKISAAAPGSGGFHTIGQTQESGSNEEFAPRIRVVWVPYFKFWWFQAYNSPKIIAITVVWGDSGTSYALIVLSSKCMWTGRFGHSNNIEDSYQLIHLFLEWFSLIPCILLLTLLGVKQEGDL